MIKICAVVITSLFINFAIGQNLSLDQMMALRTKSLAVVEEHLSSLNCEMVMAEAEFNGSLGSVDFAYKKSDISDKAESFIRYIYKTSDSTSNRIKVQINTLGKYNQYMARIKAMGFILRKTEVKEGEIIKVYTGKGVAIEVSTSTNRDELTTTTTYSLLICEINQYYILWGW